MLAKKYPWEILRTRVSQGKEEKVVFFFPLFFQSREKRKSSSERNNILDIPLEKEKQRNRNDICDVSAPDSSVPLVLVPVVY